MRSQEDQTELKIEFLEACIHGELENVKKYIELGAELTAKDNKDYTALHIACEHGYLDIVKYLVDEQNMSVNTPSIPFNRQPLHVAAFYAHLDIVKYLVEKGADIHATTNGLGERSVLFMACNKRRKGSTEVVKYLFLEKNVLMPIMGMFKYPELMKEKMGRVTDAQSILDYFLQNKSKYKPKDIQAFKEEFLEFQMSEEDSSNLKSIIKFL